MNEERISFIGFYRYSLPNLFKSVYIKCQEDQTSVNLVICK